MKLLITGGAGFVGAQLAFYLKDRGHEVVVMDNLVRRGSELNLPLLQARGIPFLHGDVRNAEDFVPLPKGIDVICETCAQPSAIDGYANPLFDINNNTLGLMHVLEFARRRGCGLIFWSTNKVYSGDQVNQFPRREEEMRWVWDKEAIAAQYGDRLPPGFDPDWGFSDEFTIDGGQHSIYGLSKVMGDLACQEYAEAFGVKTVVNRFSCLAGEGQFGRSAQGWVTWWAIAFYFGLPLKYIGWNGKQVRDTLFIEDVCRLVERELEHLDEIAGEVFNIGGGPRFTLSLREATALLREKFGRDVPVILEDDPRRADQCIYISDIRKAKERLGWEPAIGIEEGYDRILAWIRENEEDLKRLYRP